MLFLSKNNSLAELTEYQHNLTRVNTNQHESGTYQHESTRAQHESKTSQRKSTKVRYESNSNLRINKLQKYLTRSFYLWIFFSGTMSALYLTAKVSSQILYWVCLLFTLVWFVHLIGVVTKRLFNVFLIIEHILMMWRRIFFKKLYSLFFMQN